MPCPTDRTAFSHEAEEVPCLRAVVPGSARIAVIVGLRVSGCLARTPDVLLSLLWGAPCGFCKLLPRFGCEARCGNYFCALGTLV